MLPLRDAGSRRVQRLRERFSLRRGPTEERYRWGAFVASPGRPALPIPILPVPMARPDLDLSLVVPVYDEEENLPVLHGEIARHVGAMGVTWEVVYVDDRSRDRSFQVLLALKDADPHVRIVRFRRNFGQTPAMAAGFEQSRGRVVVTLDADLQNDPADIPRLVARLDDGFDVVVGWRKNRKDGLWLRKVPSRIANRMIARITGAHIHDTGCTLKAFRRELVENLPIYAEQHRFLPVLALASGARIDEVVVNHRPRIHGVSKYGIGRAMRVALDLLTMKMLSSFSRSPLSYFALLATPFVLLPVLYLMVGAWGFGVTFSGNWGQAALLTFVLVSMAGMYFLMLGLLAELVVKVSGKPFDPLVQRTTR
jgi:glycosyltransferase involved in cell wall biosynthesis